MHERGREFSGWMDVLEHLEGNGLGWTGRDETRPNMQGAVVFLFFSISFVYIDCTFVRFCD